VTVALLLLTGVPGVGKTTVVRRVVERLEGRRLRGFLTEEIRERGRRVGFALQTLAGERATLAHVEQRSPHRVGRYGVDVAALDRVVGAALAPDPGVELFVVDEIGKMECFSRAFVAAMEALLAAGRPVLATVALRGGGFIARVKQRPGALLWEVTHRDREGLPGRVLARVAQQGVAPAGDSCPR
jgi:nucleoside-triphosphatase